MEYEVHVKQSLPAHVVTKRTHTTIAELGSTIGDVLQSVAGTLTPPGSFRGAPFVLYHGEMKPEDLDVEVGIPVAPGASAAGEVKDIPGGPVAYTTHVGPYESIGTAYEALFGWMRAHGLQPSGPPREVYLVGPGPATKPEDYRTEIEVPVAS